MRLFAAALIFIATGVLAQTQTPGWPTIGFDPPALNAGSGPTLGTDARILGLGHVRVGLGFSYERAPLRLVRETEGGGEQLREVISHRVTTQLFVEFGILEWLDLQLQLPLVLFQQGEDLTSYGLRHLDSTGIGSPMVGARARILAQDSGAPVSLAVQLAVQLPIGSMVAISGDQVAFLPQVQLARDFGLFHVGGLVGLTVRKPADFGDRQLGHGFDAAATVGIGYSLRAELTGRAHIPFSNEGVSGEALAGVRATGLKWVDFFAVAGPAFGNAPGVPAFRAVVGVAFNNVYPNAAPAPAPVAPVAIADPCAGPDGPVGCPLLDFDHDGVINRVDDCPAVVGPISNHGCPIGDTDSDGVLDDVDACKTVPGPIANEGCPYPDTDGDGVPDNLDACVHEPGPVERRGCPIADRDGDGVPDSVDNCPTEPGPATNQGCPAQRKQLVIITSDRLLILQKVYFETGKAVIQSRSFALLNQVAAVLTAHPELRQLRIEGHTDDVGGAEMNRKLSERRASSVKAYLLKAKVTGVAIEAKGYGPDHPTASNETAAGRELNRRVEFTIVEDKS